MKNRTLESPELLSTVLVELQKLRQKVDRLQLRINRIEERRIRRLRREIAKQVIEELGLEEYFGMLPSQ